MVNHDGLIYEEAQYPSSGLAQESKYEFPSPIKENGNPSPIHADRSRRRLVLSSLRRRLRGGLLSHHPSPLSSSKNLNIHMYTRGGLSPPQFFFFLVKLF